MGFYGIVMGFYGSLMGFFGISDGILMGFFMGYMMVTLWLCQHNELAIPPFLFFYGKIL
jgi:hypothetical protein